GTRTGSASRSFTVPDDEASISGPLDLYLQIHGLNYDDEVGVRINDGTPIIIENQNVTVLGLGKNFGGIGGAYHTLKLTLSIPAGSLIKGQNSISFIFNKTDGVTSGFRVLAFNFQRPDGSKLLADSEFVQEDPNSWQPPLNTPEDIAA